MEDTNSLILRECLATPLLRKAAIKPGESSDSDAAELAEFVDYVSGTLFSSLPTALRTASHAASLDDPSLKEAPLSKNPFIIPLECIDSLVHYQIVADAEEAEKLLLEAVEEYIAAATAPPPVWVTTRRTECEICEREVPLTYHHLIPKAVHVKVLKRGWHKEFMLNSVAWLCRPCHSTVHRTANNEVLARELYTVPLLLEREDIQKWRGYISKQRWGKR